VTCQISHSISTIKGGRSATVVRSEWRRDHLGRDRFGDLR
jgi:hypothetical protein